MKKLLIVDDSRSIRISLSELLELEKFKVTPCGTAEECRRLLQKNEYDLVIYNAYLPTMDGCAFMNFLREKGIDINVIMSTHKSEIDIIVKCVRQGVLDFIEKPFDVNKILSSIRYAFSNISPKKSSLKLGKIIRNSVPEIIGNSPGVLQIKKMIKSVTECDARVLITGPNGTGKELVAKWIHALSNRKDAPLIEVNCAAIPNDLIESVLFGHEKGSFTSSIAQHIGKFELANGGTLFLDEIGDMSLSAQAKVLRVLQEHKFGRVGGTKEVDIDVRVIAATNKNLKEEMKNGNFREDLFYRLNVMPIHVPSLAERTEDVPELVEHFISSICNKYGKERKEITIEAMSLLKKRAWTGNIRELQNVVERLVILSEEKITQMDVDEYCND